MIESVVCNNVLYTKTKTNEKTLQIWRDDDVGEENDATTTMKFSFKQRIIMNSLGPHVLYALTSVFWNTFIFVFYSIFLLLHKPY